MPAAHVLRRSAIQKSFRVRQVLGMFDVPDKKELVHEWRANIPCEDRPWKIGLIAGPSGSGKTTLGTECFPQAHFHRGFKWDPKASVLDGFPETLSIKDITAALNAVGFSSPPHWLKPFAHLSNGQKFRVELARCLLLDTDTVVFDEFTSVVDRDVAKICSAAISKTIRKRPRPQLVALSCHFDIIDWLQPDWIYDVATARFEWRRLRRRPPIRLHICQTTRRAWTLFGGHHYLSARLHQSARCHVAFWNDKPVAFTAVMHQPHARNGRLKREHRTVVLPDYQGVGIGNAVSEQIAHWYTAQGFQYSSVTSHPAMIHHRLRSPHWRLSRKIGHQTPAGRNSGLENKGQFQAFAKFKASDETRRRYFTRAITNGDEQFDDLSKQTRAGIERCEQLHATGRGSELKGVRGTLWGAYNALTEYVDHVKVGEEDNGLFYMAAGRGARIKARGFELAKDMLTASN